MYGCIKAASHFHFKSIFEKFLLKQKVYVRGANSIKTLPLRKKDQQQQLFEKLEYKLEREQKNDEIKLRNFIWTHRPTS
jgi:hypothetical protein